MAQMKSHGIKFSDYEWQAVLNFAEAEKKRTGYVTITAGDVVRNAVREYLKQNTPQELGAKNTD